VAALRRRVRGHFACGSATLRYPLSSVCTQYTVMKLEIAEAV
jgi:hypothetical protein